MEKINTWMLAQFVAAMSKLEAEEGQGMVEYALILFLVSIVAIAALTLIGTNVDGVYDQIAAAL